MNFLLNFVLPVKFSLLETEKQGFIKPDHA